MKLSTSLRSAAAALVIAGGVLAATIPPTFADDSMTAPDQTPTTITLKSDAPGYISPGAVIHLRGRVQPNAYGTVVIKDGDNVIGVAWADWWGRYTFTINPNQLSGAALDAGPNGAPLEHDLTAMFLGNDYFAPSTPAPVAEVVRGIHF